MKKNDNNNILAKLSSQVKSSKPLLIYLIPPKELKNSRPSWPNPLLVL